MITIPLVLFFLIGWLYPSTPTASDIAREIERQRLAREEANEKWREQMLLPVDDALKKRVADRIKLASDRAKK